MELSLSHAELIYQMDLFCDALRVLGIMPMHLFIEIHGKKCFYWHLHNQMPQKIKRRYIWYLQKIRP